MISFEFHARTRVVFAPGAAARLGDLARELGFRRTLVVADRGVVDAGCVEPAIRALEGAGVSVLTFHEFAENPDSLMIERGRAAAAAFAPDSIVGVGGGSSLDCAKGINFLLTNGGTIAEYRGYAKTRAPLLPMIGVPTTAGTGSEAQSYAVISDAATHMKMAIGDPTAAVKVALLDPDLTLTAPRHVTAAAGYDAIAHAVETWVTTARNAMSEMFARRAWELLSESFERVLAAPGDRDARAAMLAGSHFAGSAIEQSMLGAAHACANPLTARYGVAHGLALSMLLPTVVRWNASAVGDRYAALVGTTNGAGGAETLATLLERFAQAGGLGGRLRNHGVTVDALPELAALAAEQWTGTFNPRPFDAAGAAAIYRGAL